MELIPSFEEYERIFSQISDSSNLLGMDLKERRRQSKGML